MIKFIIRFPKGYTRLNRDKFLKFVSNYIQEEFPRSLTECELTDGSESITINGVYTTAYFHILGLAVKHALYHPQNFD